MRAFGDLSFEVNQRSYETLGLGLGTELTASPIDALEYGARFRYEWADHLQGTYCEDGGSGCTQTTREVAMALALLRWRHAVGDAGAPVVYITGLSGVVSTRTSKEIVRSGPRAFASETTDRSFGMGADVGLELGQSDGWRGFVEIGIMDIDGFHGFAPAMSLRSGAVYEWR
ncbi:MAG: hypothetical protein ACKVU1_02870 [bacterium]